MGKLISVVIPVFNAEKYLTEAIESVLSQTYTEFELLLMYDESTDGTKKIIDDYEKKDPRIRIITNPHKKGLVSALNHGIAQARGEIIVRFDADDICLPDRFKSQVEFLEKNPKVAVVGSWFEFFGPRVETQINRHPVYPVEVTWKFGWNTRLGHPTVAFRKKIVAAYGNYPQMRAEDFALFSKIAQEHRVSNVPAVLLKYRWHFENKSYFENDEIQTEVYAITSEIMKYYSMPEKFHVPYVHFHWKKEIPLRENVLQIIYWNYRIIFSIAKKLGFISDSRFYFVFLPKATVIIAGNLRFQLKTKAKRYARSLKSLVLN